MKVLVTGGAGFIGANVARALLERGESVAVADNYDPYYDPKIKRQRIRNLRRDFPGREFRDFEADITKVDQMHRMFNSAEFDRVVHLAAKAGVRESIENPGVYEEVNIRGTVNLLQESVKHKVENFVFASSSSVYGNNPKIPFSEADNVDNPISPYATTKKACELLAHVYSHLHGLNVSCLRFFTVYGPDSRPDMMHRKFADMIAKGEKVPMYGDGESERDYTYIEDIVDGVVSALDNPHRYEIFNLGNSSPVSLKRVMEEFRKHFGEFKIDVQEEQPGDAKRTYADISKAKRMLRYEPKVSFEEGMRRFCEWYKSQ